MIKWIEATGKNEEAAIASALSQLGLERDDVSVEILERAKSGFLGLGSTPARVKVSYEAPDEIRPKKEVTVKEAVVKEAPVKEAPVREPVKETAPIKETAKEAAPKVQAPVHQTAAPAQQVASPVSEEPHEGSAASGDAVEKIHSFLTGLMTQLDVQATPRIEARAEGGYQVYLEGDQLGALIGHRGETLDAIQQLTNYSVNRSRTKRIRIHIDVENYRAKREESLRRLAEKVAGKVVKYRKNITLEPMNAYERHVIHEALQEFPDVVTYSTGTEPNRRTVVAYTKGKHKY
ncbi:MAG: R-binding protein Jag [Firmicutes bacterium]|nr:R-binding protein Jag [Bacillota bacterium]